MDMYDSAHALEQLQGKYLALFGDSTLQENMYDIIILLSGLNRYPEALDRFMNTSVWYVTALPKLQDLGLNAQSLCLLT